MSLKVLSIDTTSESGSIALVEDQRVMEEVPLHSPEGFSCILFQAVESLLLRYSVELSQIDGYAAAAGPGSFTGVRVGLTAVKGLAAAMGRPVVAVSNLQALACHGGRPLRAPVLDARRGEVFGAVYDAALNLLVPEAAAPLPDWLQRLPEGDLELITNGVPLTGERIHRPVVVAPKYLAGAIGRIATARIAAGEGKDPAEIDANYVRRSDAELAWRDAR